MGDSSGSRLAGEKRSNPDPVVLWGKDHLELGEVTVRSPSPTVALAISKGWEAKRYPHTDPNEDAVGAVVDDRASLLVCADGHNGFDSVQVAVTVVVERLGNRRALEEISTDEIVSAFGDAHEAVLQAAGDAFNNPESRTTLVVAAISGRRLRWTAIGDSALFVSSPSEVRRLDKPRRRFLGWPEMTREEVPDELKCGERALQPGSWIVLATDGFTDFAPRRTPDEAVWDASREAAGPADVARALVELAFSGEAGDNVAVAVAGPIG